MSGLSFFGNFLKTNKYGLRKIKQFNQVKKRISFLVLVCEIPNFNPEILLLARFYMIMQSLM